MKETSLLWLNAIVLGLLILLTLWLLFKDFRQWGTVAYHRKKEPKTSVEVYRLINQRTCSVKHKNIKNLAGCCPRCGASI